MRLGPVVLAMGLVCAAPAHAGIFSLLSGAAKLGKLAGKAGKAGKLAKGASVLKGAGKLSALVAAERVFAHTARNANRVPVFVTKADDGLKVVLASGDELAHTPGSLQRFTRELDEMAQLSDEAGVDLYLDASVADDLAQLPLGPNTHVYLANIDGPSLPLRAVEGVTQAKVGNNLWLRLGSEALERAVLLAASPPVEVEVVTSGPCGVEPLEAMQQAAPGQTVVVLDDLDVTDRAAWVAYASAHQLDLVVLGLDEVCTADTPAPAAQQAASRVSQAPTWADVWALAQGDLPEVAMVDGRLELRSGAALWSIHPPVAEAPPPAEEPEWLKALGGFGILVVFTGGWWMLNRWQKGSDPPA